MPILKLIEGRWVVVGGIKCRNQVYGDAIARYINCLQPLFIKAREKSEFDFIHTLIGVRETQPEGWDPWENTIRVFKCMMKMRRKVKDYETRTHLYLWLYGHIIEAAEPYEIIANLIHIIAGRRFHPENFPNKKHGKALIPPPFLRS